jgi:hypothetical protein
MNKYYSDDFGSTVGAGLLVGGVVWLIWKIINFMAEADKEMADAMKRYTFTAINQKGDAALIAVSQLNQMALENPSYSKEIVVLLDQVKLVAKDKKVQQAAAAFSVEIKSNMKFAEITHIKRMEALKDNSSKVYVNNNVNAIANAQAESRSDSSLFRSTTYKPTTYYMPRYYSNRCYSWWTPQLKLDNDRIADDAFDKHDPVLQDELDKGTLSEVIKDANKDVVKRKFHKAYDSEFKKSAAVGAGGGMIGGALIGNAIAKKHHLSKTKSRIVGALVGGLLGGGLGYSGNRLYRGHQLVNNHNDLVSDYNYLPKLKGTPESYLKYIKAH